MKFVVVLIAGLVIWWTINLVRAVAKKHWLGRPLKINKEIK